MQGTYLINRKRRIIPNHTRQTRKERPRICTPLQRRLLIPHLPSIRRHKRPDQNRNPRNWHNHTLGHKQPPQRIRVHTQKRHTGTPKQEKRHQRICLDALALRNRVVQSQERWPNRANHDAHGICAVHVLNGEPENGENGA
jgi:hypothetical protein